MNDSFPVGVSREICRICYQVNAVGFSVPDDVWQRIVPPPLQNCVICLTCFARLADEKLIPWDRRISFYPVSLSSHISRTVSAVDQGADELVIHFFGQGSGADCFVVAAMNCCRWLGIEPPLREQLIKIGKGEHGCIIDKVAVLESCGLKMGEVKSAVALHNGGIVTVMHPRYNLHSAFCQPVGEGKVLLVNAQLDESLVSVANMQDVPLPNPLNPLNDKGWVFVQAG